MIEHPKSNDISRENSLISETAGRAFAGLPRACPGTRGGPRLPWGLDLGACPCQHLFLNGMLTLVQCLMRFLIYTSLSLSRRRSSNQQHIFLSLDMGIGHLLHIHSSQLVQCPGLSPAQSRSSRQREIGAVAWRGSHLSHSLRDTAPQANVRAWLIRSTTSFTYSHQAN